MTATDILVIGGGITGLAATAALAGAGFEVGCVDPAPADMAAAPRLDGRTTALFPDAVRTLSAVGAWDACTDVSAGLWTMRIVDDGPGGPKHAATFESRDLPGGGPFGWNVPNATLRQALIARLAELPNAEHLSGRTVEELRFAGPHAEATLSDGREIHATLVIGADGKKSMTRDAAGIAARAWAYGQTAMAFSVAHSRAHEGISTEFHRPQGPLVLVPMRGNASSVVWVERERAAETFSQLDRASFRRIFAERLHGTLGRIEDIGRVGTYPVTTLLADAYAGHRVALIGEAAHGLPPIGAQGLNLGLTDVAVLTEALAEARRNGQDIGAHAILRGYERRRRPDVVARVAGVDALNRAVMTRNPALRAARHLGVRALAGCAPVRRALMQTAMSPLGRRPAMSGGTLVRPVASHTGT
ncbi:2-octaprenyl-6-methoxyphenol hydroxylase [Limimonas halophila]|uniref:2-octaprenyl-6-methoxyphenol hydroxylase n=1 Tax=Limimonas halophila TaxID=1082479 RepID=A0A1G7NK52_9PROT|nr:FAD-dependent monooxygenase [Limimonas halophila]SDF74336.1 2-octaprenyl-6-methoxyphenol hydroxylase [Limimonas halophila]